VLSPSVAPFISSGSPSSSSRPMAIPPRPGSGQAAGGAGGNGSGGTSVAGSHSQQFARTPPFAAGVTVGSETTLGLMQRQSMEMGSSVPRRGSGADPALGSSQPSFPLSVTPFRDPTGRKASISGGAPASSLHTGSPTLQAVTTPPTPAQRVQITPQLPPLDLKRGSSSSQGRSGDSPQPNTPGGRILPLGGRATSDSSAAAAAAAAASMHDEDEDEEDDDLTSFHTFVSDLQQQGTAAAAASDQSRDMFASSAGGGQSQSSSQFGQQSISSSGDPSAAGGVAPSSLSMLGVGGSTLRQTSAQTLFDQLDRLTAASESNLQQQ
jgi:hypothetical protein